MRYIKKFENNSNIPKIGDYVLMNEDGASLVSEFIDNNIGVVKDIINDDLIDVIYSNIPLDIAQCFRDYGTRFYLTQVVEFDENLEKLKLKIEAKKYNL